MSLQTRAGPCMIRLVVAHGTIESVARCYGMCACRFQKSSIIDRVTFDDAGQTLSVLFRQTGNYVYYDVPSALFEALCRAGSAGTFFNERIKGHFRCQRDPGRRRFGPNAGNDLSPD